VFRWLLLGTLAGCRGATAAAGRGISCCGGGGAAGTDPPAPAAGTRITTSCRKTIGGGFTGSGAGSGAIALRYSSAAAYSSSAIAVGDSPLHAGDGSAGKIAAVVKTVTTMESSLARQNFFKNCIIDPPGKASP
jgi:hypothetical protein